MTSFATGRAFHALAIVRPPDGIVVDVLWPDAHGLRGPFPAARARDPGSGARCWLTHDHGRPVLLPYTGRQRDPSRPWAGWHTLRGADPAYWAPQNAAAWDRLANPLPAEPALVLPATLPQRLWSSSCAFDATAAAEEMEADREAARARRDEDEPPEQQWWLDPTAVTYSPPGRVSMREAEGRLMRAFAAEWWVRIEWPRLKTASASIANMAPPTPLAPGELAAQDPPPARTEPTGRDRDDMLTALGWLSALRLGSGSAGTLAGCRARVPVGGPRHGRPGGARLRQDAGDRSAEQIVLRLRGSTPALTWRRIGEDVGRSGMAARGLYQRALVLVTEAANGGPTEETAAVWAERAAECARLDGLKANRKRG